MNEKLGGYSRFACVLHGATQPQQAFPDFCFFLFSSSFTFFSFRRQGASCRWYQHKANDPDPAALWRSLLLPTFLPLQADNASLKRMRYGTEIAPMQKHPLLNLEA